jgi:serine/threonine-protein kinase
MLWELCAGRRFLQGDAGAHMANVARNQCSPPPVAAACGAPVELDGIIAKLTAFDREARYGESRAVARDLAKLLSSAPVIPSGERGVRARAANLMTSLFPFEPERSRREFAKLIIAAAPLRKTMSTSPEERAAASSASPEGAAKESKRAESVEPGGDPSLLPGTRYRLLREIGRGASSVVYEAEHIDLGRKVALKVLAAEHTGVREFASRFRREARAMSRLSHEHLVKIDDFGLAADGRLFCVMELLEGETLEELLAREKSVPWEKALSIAQRALRALEVAHAASVIHRDIKPANLFLTRGGGLKLLDFGLAKAPDKGLTDAPSAAQDEKGEDLTKRPGLTILGTPEYMAPEQASSGQGDPRSDIYAVGSVMYEMLAGSLPFSGSSPVALLAAKIKAMPERPKERSPAKDIPRAADEIVMRAMARHPSLRFQSACEMRQAIEKVLDAPAASRLRRRVVGLSAIAATMAFAAVLLVGRASEIRSAAGRLLSSPTSAAEVTAAVEVQDPPAAPAPENVEPSEQPIAEGTPIEAAPVQIGPEPPLGDSSSAANAAGSAGSEPTDSDQSDEEAAAEPKAALAQAAPRKARPRQHSKISDKAKGSSEVALAKAATSKETSGDTKAAKASADAVVAKETAKAVDKPATDEKTASNAKAAEPAQSAPNAEGSDAADPSDPKATDRSARKGSPAKPSRKDVPPNRRKKKTRLAKKGE